MSLMTSLQLQMANVAILSPYCSRNREVFMGNLNLNCGSLFHIHQSCHKDKLGFSANAIKTKLSSVLVAAIVWVVPKYLNRLAINVDWDVTPHTFNAEARGFNKCHMIIFEQAARCKTTSDTECV